MKVKENTNIVQSNFLLENRPKFTKDETRLFLTIVASINKDEDDFKPLEIPVSEFADLWGLDSNAAYRKIKEALRGLVQKEFFIEGVNQKTGKTRFLSMSYVSMATYEEGEGYATVEISKAFKPYLLALKKNYTKYVLENILHLSTVNAIRNYELLKQYESLGKRSFTIDEYKKILGIEKKYSLNADLKRYVIEPSLKEINSKTDIWVDYRLVGRGVKAKISFTIKKQKIEASAVTGTTINKEKKKITFVDESGIERVLELEYNQLLEFDNGEFRIITQSDEEIKRELELIQEHEQEQLEGQTSLEENLSIEEKELQVFRSSLKRGVELTEEQLEDISFTLKNCQYIQDMMFHTLNLAERERLKIEYLTAQEKYTLANIDQKGTKAYCRYLVGAIKDNYKKIGGWWDKKEDSSQKSSYDMDEFKRRAEEIPVYKNKQG